VTSASFDSRRLLRKARRLNLFAALDGIYALFPETRCGRCGVCCYQTPGLFYIEYLRLFELVAKLQPEARVAVFHDALRDLLFAWIEPGRSCLFLGEDHRCCIYDLRPLTCRLFGLTNPADPEAAQRELHLAAEAEADRLSWLGVEMPDATLTRAVVACRRVRSLRGRRPRLDGDDLADQVAGLDRRLLPVEVVEREYCFQSFSDRLGAALFGDETVELLRLQLLRRAQRGEPVESLVAEVAQGLRWPQLTTTHHRRPPCPSASE